MAPREEEEVHKGRGGVVDEKLGVFGVHGLKVADLSIAPGNVAATTASTALAVGERAAAIFIEELGTYEE
jgi:alcohol oxidase